MVLAVSEKDIKGMEEDGMRAKSFRYEDYNTRRVFLRSYPLHWGTESEAEESVEAATAAKCSKEEHLTYLDLCSEENYRNSHCKAAHGHPRTESLTYSSGLPENTTKPSSLFKKCRKLYLHICAGTDAQQHNCQE